jgi:hypothetical protein
VKRKTGNAWDKSILLKIKKVGCFPQPTATSLTLMFSERVN